MAWQDTMLEVLRVIIGDMDESAPINSDDNLERVLAVSAFQVLCEMTFSQSFSVNVTRVLITPDPTLEATLDESFTNLVTLKAACLLDRSTALAAAGRAIAVRDGSSAVDLRGVFGAKLKLLEKGWCAVYDDAKLEYQSGQSRVAGAVVLTPFRLYAQSVWHHGGYLDDRYR